MYKPYFKCPDYLISDTGIILSKSGKPLSQYTNHKGYKTVTMRINNKTTTVVVHTAVARTFVPGYQQDLQVNHIDGNKENNNANNLEWVTPKENMQHAVNVLKRHVGKNNPNATAVKLINPKTYCTEYTFKSIADALRFLFPNITKKEIRTKTIAVCKHKKRNTPVYGYIWQNN